MGGFCIFGEITTMKSILLIFSALILVSCSKPEVKDIKKETSSAEVEKTFGKPTNKGELFGSEYWRYNDYIVVITNNKVDTVVTTEYMDKTTKEIENGLEQLSK